MRIITTAILATGLIFGTAGLAHAQLGGLLKKQAQGSVVDQAKNAATSQASGVVTGQASGLLGNSVGSSAPGSLTSTTLSGSESLEAGKVILGGGSTTDAAVAVGRSRVNSQIGGITGGNTGQSRLSGITSQGASGGLPGISSGTSGLGGLVGGGASSGLGGIVGGGSGFLGKPVDFPVESGGTTATAVPAISCPTGTTAQADGTCMITGNYGS